MTTRRADFRSRLRFAPLLALLFAASAGTSAAAASTFRLLDAGGRPLEDARVSVLGRAGSVRTGGGGAFRLDPVPPVPFELAVSDGRGAWLGLVRVEAVAPGTVEVRLRPPASAEVLVRAGLAPSSAAPPAAAASVVSRVEIEEKRPRRVADVLEEVPGSMRQEEGASVVPSLRGLSRGRTLLLVDDARVTAERRAGPSASFLDPFSLENLEVVRGPGSVAWGSDALGGVLHARTPMPSPDGFAARWELSAGVGGDRGASGGVEANVPLLGGAFLVQAHQRWADDYESPPGPVDVSSARDRGFLLRVLVPAGRARLFAGLQADQGRDVGKPASDSDVTRASYPKEDSTRVTLGADLDGALGFSSIELRAFAGRYRLVTERDRLATPEKARRLSRADVDADDASLRATGARPLGRGVLRAGLDVSSRFGLEAVNTFVDFDASGAAAATVRETAVEDARKVDAGLFVETEQPLREGRLSVAAGLRGDHVATRNRGGAFGDLSRSETSPSGFLSVTGVPVPDLSVTLQWARGFREPTLSDRYFRGVSGRGYVVGNPDLSPETSSQWDLSARLSAGPVRLAAYAYLYRLRDLIERYQDGPDYRFRNRGSAEILGAELEADVTLRPGLVARVTATTARGRVLDDGTPAADVPPESVSLSLDHAVSERLFWRARWFAAARRDDPGPAEAVVPGYAVLDASAGLRLKGRWELRLVLRNLLDRAYPGSPDPAAALAPGRSAMLVVGGGT